MWPRTFPTRIGLIAFGAFVLRVAYVISRRDAGIRGDALTFWLDAAHLADGQGFQRAFEPVPTAEHPPLHVVLLAALHRIGLGGYNDQKLVLCLVGTATVVLIGLVARDLAGDGAGLMAAAIGAVYPPLWLADATLMSETPYALLVIAVVACAYWFQRVPGVRRAAALGVVTALAALTRPEAMALVVLLILPLAWRASPAWGGRLRVASVAVLAFLIVIAPWSIRNALTFEEPILISANTYGAVIGANCHESWYGDQLGSWAYTCFRDRAPGDESQYSVDYRDRGLRYIRDHAQRLPVVLAARMGRFWEVYRPRQSVYFQGSEGRSGTAARAGIAFFWLLIGFWVAGLVILRRRGASVWPLCAPIAMALIVALMAYGSTRLRIAAEPSFVVLAGVSAHALAQRVRRGRAAARPG